MSKTKKTKKLIPLTINRKRWARGGKNGDAALLNTEGNMCCLGFACKKLGFSVNEINGIGAPCDLMDALQETKAQAERAAKKLAPLAKYRVVMADEYGVDVRGEQKASTDNAMSINDDTDITDSVRERKLVPVLKRLGFNVKFVG